MPELDGAKRKARYGLAWARSRDEGDGEAVGTGDNVGTGTMTSKMNSSSAANQSHVVTARREGFLVWAAAAAWL